MPRILKWFKMEKQDKSDLGSDTSFTHPQKGQVKEMAK